MSAVRRLQIVAAVSGIYDASVGVMMLAGRPLLVSLFSVPPPVPPIHADLNGIFLLAIAVGYLIPYRDAGASSGRAYLWIMGTLLKGTGAAAFIFDYLLRGSPKSFLLFAASDGTLALLTMWALVTSRAKDATTRRSEART